MNLFKKILLGLAITVSSLSFGQLKDTPLDDWWYVQRDAAVVEYDCPDENSPGYNTVYYIDPNASTNGSGTQANPFNVFPSSLQANTAYLFKRGTTYEAYQEFEQTNADYILFGAYGTGDKPIVRFTGSSKPLWIGGDHHVYRDIHWKSRVDLGAWGGGSHCWVYNCEMEGTLMGSNRDMLTVWSNNTKIIGVDIHDITREGIYMKPSGVTGVEAYGNNEIAWCRLWNINMDWAPGVSEVDADGDAIQISGVDSLYIHHNIIDRSTTGNKFCLIIRDEYEQAPAIWFNRIENNIMYIPIQTAWGGAGIYLQEAQHTIIKNNTLVATSSNSNMSCIQLAGQGGQIDVEIYGNLIIRGQYDIADNYARDNINETVFNNTFWEVDGTKAGNWEYNRNNIKQQYYSAESATNIILDNTGSSSVFVAPNETDYNFRLKAGSPAIEAGVYSATYASMYTEDLDGQRVPQNDSVSSGSYQYNTGGAVPGPCDGVTILQSGTVTNTNVGEQTGAIDVTVSGGTAPYTYSWSNGATTQDISNLGAGVYTLTVTDNNGCFSTANYTVNNIYGTSGALTVVATGASDFQDPNVPDNAIDNNQETYYASNLVPHYWVADFNVVVRVDSFEISFTGYAGRSANMTWGMSTDSTNIGAITADTSTIGVQNEMFTVGLEGRYFHLGLWDNSSNSGWNSITQITFFGDTVVTVPVETNWFDSTAHYYPFNGNHLDTVGTNHMTQNSQTYTTDNLGNAGFAISTNNSAATFTDWNFGASQEWTLMWWLRPSNATGELFRFDSDNEIVMVNNTLNFDNSGVRQSFNYTFNTSTWYHIALVAQSSNYLRLFVDSVLVDSVLLTDNEFHADEMPGAGTPMDGRFDEVVVAYKAFPQEGVAAGYKRFPTPAVNPCDTTTIVISETVVDVTCSGLSDGIINITTIGGDESYTYSWSNGAITQNVSGLAAGNYSVTVTDGNGCIGTKAFTVSEPAALFASYVINNGPSCYGDKDASVTITPSGGTSPYDIHWTTNGVHAAQIDTLRGDILYEITVTDANSCTYDLSFLINSPSVLLIDTEESLVLSDTANQGVGSIVSSVMGGTSPYTYLWSSGETTSFIISKTAGNYSLTLTDNNGCDTEESFTILNYDPTPPEPSDLDTINYAVDTKLSDWFYKINAGINEANVRTSGSLPVLLLIQDTGETTYTKVNAFIKLYPAIQNDTLVWPVDNNREFKVKSNAAIWIESQTN